jgi:hypothetical protein
MPMLAILQIRISAKYWQCCRGECIPAINHLQRRILSKYWQVSDETTCQLILRFLQMRIPTMDNIGEYMANIGNVAEENIF